MPVRDLTIVVPAYNEARRIEATLEGLLAFARTRTDPVEILVVDDGSLDGTRALVERRFGREVQVLVHARRRGKGAAVRTGILASQRTWVLFVDADLSIPIEELEKLEPLTDAHPIVIGSKRAPGSDVHLPWMRRTLGGMGQRLISTCVVGGFHDTQCGFKLFRGDVAKRLFAAQKIDGFGFDFEVLYLARRFGYPVAEVAVRCAHQLGSTVSARSYLRVLAEVMQVTWNRVSGGYPRA